MNKFLLSSLMVAICHTSLTMSMFERAERRQQINAFFNSYNRVVKNTSGEDLVIAVSHGNTQSVKALLDDNVTANNLAPFADEEHKTPLFAAAHIGSVPLVELLLEKGASVNYQHKIKRYPPFRHTALTIALLRRHYNVAQVLIEHGADVLAPFIDSASSGGTPLMLTANSDNPDSLETPLSPDTTAMCKMIIVKLLNQNGSAYALQEICKIEDGAKKEYLLTLFCQELNIEDKLALYKYLARDESMRYCWTPGCTFNYSLEEPGMLGQMIGYVWGERTISCPQCSKPLVINQPKYPSYCKTPGLFARLSASFHGLPI